MNCNRRITISNIPEISAIYFALLQCGYDFYDIERADEHVQTIKSFYATNTAVPFFCATKQSTCEVYPYWPRAAMLEEATFYLSCDKARFAHFDVFQKRILSAGNISDIERNQLLWDWIIGFPQALNSIIDNAQFIKYLEWENQWIQMQNKNRCNDQILLEKYLSFCTEEYHSPVRSIQIVLSPIKCVYSSDYYLIDDRFIFSSGAFRVESVLHEFLHHVVHPAVMRHKEQILERKRCYHGIDTSYYLSGDDNGQLNAFEEFAVRSLTKKFISGTQPNDLDKYIIMEMNNKD